MLALTAAYKETKQTVFLEMLREKATKALGQPRYRESAGGHRYLDILFNDRELVSYSEATDMASAIAVRIYAPLLTGYPLVTKWKN